MSTLPKRRNLLFVIALFAGYTCLAQKTPATTTKEQPVMKTFLIEREIPNAGQFTPADLKGISQKSCSVLQEMGPGIQWIHSYVTGNKIYCIYKAESEELIRKHAEKGGFPANSIVEVGTVISPATAK